MASTGERGGRVRAGAAGDPARTNPISGFARGSLHTACCAARERVAARHGSLARRARAAAPYWSVPLEHDEFATNVRRYPHARDDPERVQSCEGVWASMSELRAKFNRRNNGEVLTARQVREALEAFRAQHRAPWCAIVRKAPQPNRTKEQIFMWQDALDMLMALRPDAPVDDEAAQEARMPRLPHRTPDIAGALAAAAAGARSAVRRKTTRTGVRGGGDASTTEDDYGDEEAATERAPKRNRVAGVPVIIVDDSEYENDYWYDPEAPADPEHSGYQRMEMEHGADPVAFARSRFAHRFFGAFRAKTRRPWRDVIVVRDEVVYLSPDAHRELLKESYRRGELSRSDMARWTPAGTSIAHRLPRTRARADDDDDLGAASRPPEPSTAAVAAAVAQRALAVTPPQPPPPSPPPAAASASAAAVPTPQPPPPLSHPATTTPATATAAAPASAAAVPTPQPPPPQPKAVPAVAVPPPRAASSSDELRALQAAYQSTSSDSSHANDRRLSSAPVPVLPPPTRDNGVPLTRVATSVPSSAAPSPPVVAAPVAAAAAGGGGGSVPSAKDLLSQHLRAVAAYTDALGLVATQEHDVVAADRAVTEAEEALARQQRVLEAARARATDAREALARRHAGVAAAMEAFGRTALLVQSSARATQRTTAPPAASSSSATVPPIATPDTSHRQLP